MISHKNVTARSSALAAITLTAAAGLSLVACGSAAGRPHPPATQATTSAATPLASGPSAAQVISPSAAVIASRLAQGGLPITHLITYTTVTDPNHLIGRQGEYTSKVAWQDPRAIAAGAGQPASDPGGIEFGGGMEVFASQADAAARLALLKAFRPPFGDGYDYQISTAILRLSNYLTPAQAAAAYNAFSAAAH